MRSPLFLLFLPPHPPANWGAEAVEYLHCPAIHTIAGIIGFDLMCLAREREREKKKRWWSVINIITIYG